MLFVNVGARLYTQSSPGLPADPADAPVKRRGDLLQMQFVLDGSHVRVNGRDVGEEVVRSFARSLEAYDREDWRAELGERLLVEGPE